MNFDALGRHALGELITVTQKVTYNPVSKATGDFTALHFKTRDDYDIPIPIVEDDMQFALFSNSGVTLVSNGALQATLGIDTEDYDPNNLASVAGNTVTIAGTGYYKFGIYLGWYPDNSLDFDGYVVIETSAPTGDKVYEVAGYDAAWAQQYDERRIMTEMIHLSSPNTAVQVKFSCVIGDDQDVQIYQFGVYKYA